MATIEELQKNTEELSNRLDELESKEDVDIQPLTVQVNENAEVLSTHRHQNFDDTLKLRTLFPITEHLQGAVPVTAANYGTIFINKSDKEYVVREIQVVWSTASTSGTLQVERLQGTEAKGAGDDLLSSAVVMSGTADTVNIGSLVTDRSLLTLAKGDRLGIVNAGTLTSQADLNITIYLEEI